MNARAIMNGPPSPTNDYWAEYLTLLRRAFREWTGRELLDGAGSLAEWAERLFHAPFVVLSHDTALDPVLTYGNLKVLELFELSWAELIAMPSRFTAEAPDRVERARLLAEVAAQGYIDNYSGVRISRTGRRFLIEQATVWNLTDGDGHLLGQAATFRDWQYL
jgi:hypothetical protein